MIRDYQGGIQVVLLQTHFAGSIRNTLHPEKSIRLMWRDWKASLAIFGRAIEEDSLSQQDIAKGNTLHQAESEGER